MTTIEQLTIKDSDVIKGLQALQVNDAELIKTIQSLEVSDAYKKEVWREVSSAYKKGLFGHLYARVDRGWITNQINVGLNNHFC